jgi:hypothetical protein
VHSYIANLSKSPPCPIKKILVTLSLLIYKELPGASRREQQIAREMEVKGEKREEKWGKNKKREKD